MIDRWADVLERLAFRVPRPVEYLDLEDLLRPVRALHARPVRDFGLAKENLDVAEIAERLWVAEEPPAHDLEESWGS